MAAAQYAKTPSRRGGSVIDESEHQPRQEPGRYFAGMPLAAGAHTQWWTVLPTSVFEIAAVALTYGVSVIALL